MTNFANLPDFLKCPKLIRIFNVFKLKKVGYFWDSPVIFFVVIKLPESSVSSSCIGMCM